MSVDRGTLPVLLEALRGADGDATFIATDRFYQSRRPALQAELRALTCALADAIEAHGMRGEPDPALRTPPDSPPVESFTYADRALSTARGKVSAKAIRTDRGIRWQARAEQRRDFYIFAEVPTTPEIDGAWQRLVESARTKAGPPWDQFLLWPDIRDVGIDIRGIGGPVPAGGGR
jgi:hypothetical protein